MHFMCALCLYINALDVTCGFVLSVESDVSKSILLLQSFWVDALLYAHIRRTSSCNRHHILHIQSRTCIHIQIPATHMRSICCAHQFLNCQFSRDLQKSIALAKPLSQTALTQTIAHKQTHTTARLNNETAEVGISQAIPNKSDEKSN